MKLKRRTVSLIFIFIGILTIIFGAFFSYVAYTRKNELQEELQQIESQINNAVVNNIAIETFFVQFYELLVPQYSKQSNDIKYLYSIINCLANKANYTLDKEAYNEIRSKIKKYVKLAKKYRLVSSCYFTYKGVFPDFFVKIINKVRFDVTGNDIAKSPTIVKLVSAYMDEIAKLEKEIDDLTFKIDDEIKILKKYIYIPADSSFENIKNAIEAKVKELEEKDLEDIEKEWNKKLSEIKDAPKITDIRQKKIEELEEVLDKLNMENRLSIYSYFLKKKAESYIGDLVTAINNKQTYLSGIADKVEKKEFIFRGEIFRPEDYEMLCNPEKAIIEIPSSCKEITDIICKAQDRVMSFSVRVPELIGQQLAKRIEWKELLNIKFRLDRNDIQILKDFKDTNEKLPLIAKNIITLRQMKKTLEEQIEKIRSRIARQKLEKKSVGKLLGVASKSNIGIINLGRKHGLFNNSIFEIFGMIKGREFTFKGIAKILKLGEENSKVLILPVVNVEDKNFIISKGAGIAYPEHFSVITKEFTKKLPYTDIVKISQIKGLKPEVNDALFSEIFDPKHKKTVSLAGNLHLIYTNAEISKKLAEWNFIYQEKADTNNDYVIVGKDYKNSPNYKIAKELNIKLLREKDLYDFLELEYRY